MVRGISSVLFMYLQGHYFSIIVPFFKNLRPMSSANTGLKHLLSNAEEFSSENEMNQLTEAPAAVTSERCKIII